MSEPPLLSERKKKTKMIQNYNKNKTGTLKDHTNTYTQSYYSKSAKIKWHFIFILLSKSNPRGCCKTSQENVRMLSNNLWDFKIYIFIWMKYIIISLESFITSYMHFSSSWRGKPELQTRICFTRAFKGFLQGNLKVLQWRKKSLFKLNKLKYNDIPNVKL